MDPVTLIGGVVSDIGDALGSVAGQALLGAASYVVLHVAWRYARGFIGGAAKG